MERLEAALAVVTEERDLARAEIRVLALNLNIAYAGKAEATLAGQIAHEKQLQMQEEFEKGRAAIMRIS